MTNLGWCVDIGVILFLVLHTFLGWRRGLLWQAAGVTSLAFGVGLGLAFAPALSKYALNRVTSDPLHAKLVAFLFVFGIVGFSLRLLASAAEVYSERGVPKEERAKRRSKDRVLGGIFGAIKGLVLAAIIIAACVSFYPNQPVWKKSHLAASFATAGSRLLPQGAVKEVRDWARQHVANIEQK
ncbi:MAG TPA: CvpA family protein [Planctomycetota bacterium]|nr:CvpA family protein [Planctomycetota bacterium]